MNLCFRELRREYVLLFSNACILKESLIRHEEVVKLVSILQERLLTLSEKKPKNITKVFLFFVFFLFLIHFYILKHRSSKLVL